MPAAIPYGTTNPRGLEPWSIESTLAPLAVGGSQAEAQSMLGMYRAQREAAGNVYGEDLAAQHQAAMAAIQAQLYDTRMKAISEVGKLPGGVGFVAQAPGMDQFGDQAAWSQFANAANTEQAAKNFQATGTGFRDYSEGGLLVNPQQIPGMQGVQGQLTDTARVRAEEIRQAGSNARAASAQAVAGLPRVTTNYRDPTFGTENSVSFGPKTSLQARQDFLRNQAGLVPIDQPMPNAPIPGTGGALPGVPPLPMAQTDTPANTPASGPPQNARAGTPSLQDQVKASLNRPGSVSPAAKADIMAAAAKNGGQPVVGTDAQGPYALGADGKTKYR